MRIFRRGTDQVFHLMELYLTIDEAKTLRAGIDWLLENHIEKANDFQLICPKGEDTNEYTKELRVIIYNGDNYKEFEERTIKLIDMDEEEKVNPR